MDHWSLPLWLLHMCCGFCVHVVTFILRVTAFALLLRLLHLCCCFCMFVLLLLHSCCGFSMFVLWLLHSCWHFWASIVTAVWIWISVLIELVEAVENCSLSSDFSTYTSVLLIVLCRPMLIPNSVPGLNRAKVERFEVGNSSRVHVRHCRSSFGSYSRHLAFCIFFPHPMLNNCWTVTSRIQRNQQLSRKQGEEAACMCKWKFIYSANFVQNKKNWNLIT